MLERIRRDFFFVGFRGGFKEEEIWVLKVG